MSERAAPTRANATCLYRTPVPPYRLGASVTPPEKNRNNHTRTINQPYTRAALPLRRSAKRDVAISRKGRRNCRTRLNKFSPVRTQSRARVFPKPISRSSTQKKFTKFLKYPLKTLYNFIEIKYNRHIKSLHHIKVMK